MKTKSWWKSRTLWLNALLAAGTVVEAQIGLIRSSFGAESYLALISFAAAVNAGLRFLTTQAVGK